MLKEKVIVTGFRSHTEAESAVKALEVSGFDMKELSIVARDFQSEEQILGYYNSGDRVQYWGTQGVFWGALWGSLSGSAFFWIPGVGPLVVAGPLTAWIVSALEGALVVGGISAFGAALYSVGIPKDSLLEYESALTAGKFVLILNGTSEETERAQLILRESKPDFVNDHKLDSIFTDLAAKDPIQQVHSQT